MPEFRSIRQAWKIKREERDSENMVLQRFFEGELVSLLSEKGRVIFEQEQEFAEILAARVLHKPKVVVWMILIPFLLVLYLNDLKKYKEGRKDFIEHYQITKKKALEEAISAIEEGRELDVTPLAGKADLPEIARQPYTELLSILTEHYMMLLKTTGRDYGSMIRDVFHNQTNCLLFFSQLNQAEKALNNALRQQLNQDHEGVDEVIHAMQNHSETIRKEISRKIFS